ncbi:hypothetical protein EfsSzw1_86 [Enterococcus phage EfsSzw-1]|uniref:Holin n=2 Tax=Schiekvirus TaxID=2732968 RepID=A0A411B7G3_9CAUD|nr:hypothetical protein EfsSzw1_86 [Enterococcus phage EfsSzw-1]UVD43053.1 hypothetical protein [Enterococcus phage TJE1]
MKVRKKLLYKSIFIIISVVIMIIASKLIADILGLEQHFTTTMLVGGSLWAWIASILFDSYEKRKQKDNLQQQLHEALKDLKEIKALIKK